MLKLFTIMFDHAKLFFVPVNLLVRFIVSLFIFNIEKLWNDQSLQYKHDASGIQKTSFNKNSKFWVASATEAMRSYDMS